MADPQPLDPNALPGEDFQWFWDWEKMTRKDPAQGELWRGYFRNATGVDPRVVGAETPFEALRWQQARAERSPGSGLPGVPESRDVVPDEGAPNMRSTSWWQKTLQMRFAGRLHVGEHGLEPTDPYDTEAVAHM